LLCRINKFEGEESNDTGTNGKTNGRPVMIVVIITPVTSRRIIHVIR